MERYGKIINNELMLAPIDITIGNVTYSPAKPEHYRADGWKIIITEEYPAEQVRNKHYEQTKSETAENIILGWTLANDTPEMICSRLRAWFDVNYRMYNEKLTRFAALGIEEAIDDEFRGKTYATLMELYTEAEIVREEIHALENGDLK